MMNNKIDQRNSTKPLPDCSAASPFVVRLRSPFLHSPFSFKYHPDHLSSSSWITDISGTAIQHLQYLPFGESRVDQRTTIWNSRYSFSAKEKDEESGYGYFGARYYDSDLSIWLSVDPQLSRYPSLSCYTYAANNPIKIIDPNGEELINGYGADVASAKERVAKAQNALNAFGGDKKNTGYKDAKKELKSANKSLNSAQSNYNKVQGAINNLEKHNNSLFNDLNNLKDENGTIVDVNVKLADLGGSRYGQVDENYNTGSKSFKNNMVTIELDPQSISAAQLSGTEGFVDMGSILSHEGGHVIYDIPNMTKNIQWQNANNVPPNYNGHGDGDPSGKSADYHEQKYKNHYFGK